MRRVHRRAGRCHRVPEDLGRGFMFSASGVPAAIGAALGALQVIREEGPTLFSKLLENAEYLREGLRSG